MFKVVNINYAEGSLSAREVTSGPYFCNVLSCNHNVSVESEPNSVTNHLQVFRKLLSVVLNMNKIMASILTLGSYSRLL